MSVKHIKKYYEEVTNQYIEMAENLKEVEEFVLQNIVEPERLEQLKETIKPIKDNYLTLSYIMFLLNKPNKKGKEKAYNKRMKKELQNIPFVNTKEGKLEKARKALDSISNITKQDN